MVDSAWRTLLVLAAVALAAYLVWRRRQQGPPEPEVQMASNVTPPPTPPVGTPAALAAKMAQLVDPQIPVVMTAGAPIQYDDEEVKGIVDAVLAQLNARGEYVTLIQVVSATKTVDSYKTVAYDVLANVHDNQANVALQVFVSVLVSAKGQRYIRALRMAQSPTEPAPGPEGASAGGGGGLAPFEDPIAALKNLKLD